MVLVALLVAVLQVGLFTAVPFLAYVIGHRRVQGFGTYVGLHKPEGFTLIWATVVSVVGTLLFLGIYAMPDFRELATAPATVAGKLRAAGFSTQTGILLLLYAWVQTSLSEEILFRGFIAKQLVRGFGFVWGNISQAIVFGAIHLVLFAAAADIKLTFASAALLVTPPTFFGWLLGYLKDRQGNGSIVPGWLAHATSNTIAYTIIAFVW